MEALLNLGQIVVGLDDFSTGHQHNLTDVEIAVGPSFRQRFHMLEGDIRNIDVCRRAVANADYVLHQAALGSVPRSLEDPMTTDAINVGGFLNMLVAARDEGVSRFVYAASSSTYGDHEALPKIEDQIGKPLSPYAVTKYVNELYADVFSQAYGISTIGLRYFNVFGRRQDPDGAYAAVIPKWISAMLKGDDVHINGDGETSRDFCYIDNVTQANILAALAGDEAQNEVYNVGVGEATSLKELYRIIQSALKNLGVEIEGDPIYRDFRAGDVRHSRADVNKAKRLLSYAPTHNLEDGIWAAMPWYREFLQAA